MSIYKETIDRIAYDIIDTVFANDEDMRANLRAQVRAGEAEKIIDKLEFKPSTETTRRFDADDLFIVADHDFHPNHVVTPRGRFDAMMDRKMINDIIGVSRQPQLDNSEMATKGIRIYIASSARDGRAAVCARMTYGSKAKNIVFASKNSTAPEAIAVGILKAISAMKQKRCFVTVYTAASYLDNFDIYAAQKRGWMTKNKQPMASANVWKAILAKIQEGNHIVVFRKTDTGAHDYNIAMLEAKRAIAIGIDNERIRNLVEAGNTPITIKEAPSFEDIFGH